MQLKQYICFIPHFLKMLKISQEFLRYNTFEQSHHHWPVRIPWGHGRQAPGELEDPEELNRSGAEATSATDGMAMGQLRSPMKPIKTTDCGHCMFFE